MYLKFSEFQEHRYEPFVLYNIAKFVNNTNAIFLSFSVRTKEDAQVMICTDSLKTDLCYWIIISDLTNTRSIIMKCQTGWPPVRKKLEKCTIELYINVSYHIFLQNALVIK